MSKHVTQALDVEQERQQRDDELLADHGPDWAEQYKPGSFGCHELLDRTSLAADLVEQQVLSHPACVGNREWFALAERAVAALQELYQQVGTAHLDDKSNGTSVLSSQRLPFQPPDKVRPLTSEDVGQVLARMSAEELMALVKKVKPDLEVVHAQPDLPEPDIAPIDRPRRIVLKSDKE